MLSKELARYSKQQFEKRQEFLQPVYEEVCGKLLELPEDERTLMQFFYATMPCSDAGEYPFELFLAYASHALKLRTESPFCKDIPEEMFLKYVAYYRINSEKITENRAFFYEQVKERVAGLSGVDAAIAVNYWCAENVSYQAADLRTLSPMAVYTSGTGRCGEESAFAVSVLRSVGIPARQIYVPFWAHCDDNHAWVEVFVEGRWQYLGACEPEEVLNRGWFDGAASRAVIVHTLAFTDYGASTEGLDAMEPLGREGALFAFNRTNGYAAVRKSTITVLEQAEDGTLTPIQNAEVTLSLLNMAYMAPIAKLRTDAEGKVTLSLGQGSVHVRAQAKNEVAEGWWNTEEASSFSLVLSKDALVEKKEEVICEAPKEKILYAMKPTAEQAVAGQEHLDLVNAKRAGRRADRKIARAEHLRMLAENSPSGKDWLFLVAEALVDKDQRDITDAAFLDCFAGLSKETKEKLLALTMQERKEILTIAGEEMTREDFLVSYVLLGRIWYEELVPYKQWIQEHLSKEVIASLMANPKEIATYVSDHLTNSEDQDYSIIYATPIGALTMKRCTKMSARIVIVAMARTLGIAARLNPMTTMPEYFEENTRRWISFTGNDEEKASLQISTSSSDRLQYGVNFSISSIENGFEELLHLEGTPYAEGEKVIPLSAGWYVIVTTTRQPNGNQHAEREYIQLTKEEECSLQVTLHQPSIAELLIHAKTDDFYVETMEGKEESLFSLVGENKALVIFLEPGKEPSEHVMNELMAASTEICKAGLKVLFLVGDFAERNQETAAKTLHVLPEILVVKKDLSKASELARRFYVDPEKLPLMMLLREDHVGIYGVAGYHVGSVELALRLAAVSQRDEK